jgi:NAD kinase
MYVNPQPRIAVITRETRLAGLLRRWATKGQAKFVFQRARAVSALQAGAAQETLESDAQADVDFQDLETEDNTYQQAIHEAVRSLDFGMPVQVIDRQFLPNFDFRSCTAVVVIGQDGLVANTAKYALEVPIIGVNPDPKRFDGVLLPFGLSEARGAVNRVLKQQARTRDVSLARATLHDGQTLLAFNDFFLGAKSHVSARYQLRIGLQSEQQSSSGILVSTGAGSTGWMSSVFNMARGVAGFAGTQMSQRIRKMKWEDRSLLWAVREPFISQTSQAGLVMGNITEGEELVVESLMPSGGVIFSDGVESDFLEFNGGTIARLTVAAQRAKLVVR